MQCFLIQQNKKGIEGTLFFFTRNSLPSSGIVVLNRLSTENFYVVLSDNLENHISGEFVLFRTNQGIQGLWAYQEPDRIKINQLLSNSANKVDIMAMFQKSIMSQTQVSHMPQIAPASARPNIQCLEDIWSLLGDRLSMQEFHRRLMILLQNGTVIESLYAQYLKK